MHIECRSCPVRGKHCADCMVTVLLEMPVLRVVEEELDLALDDHERRGLERLVAAGLISEGEVRGARAVRETDGMLRVTG